MKTYILCYCFALFIIYPATAQPFDYPTANLSNTWTNIESAPHSVSFNDGSTVRAILLRGTFGPRFACGFYCNGDCNSYLFAVFIVQTNSGGRIVQPAVGFPQVVWSANRDYPVRLGATVNFTAAGELVLQDVDGSIVWTANNTTGKSVVGMNLTDAGNLVLFDVNRTVVWQSFDYPTDSLVPGQRLFQGQQLIPSVSSTNWMTQKDLISLQVIEKSGLYAYVNSNPPQPYYSNLVRDKNTTTTSIEKGYVRFLNGSLSLFIYSAEPSDPDAVISIPQASSAQFMKLMPDGHLKVFEWQTAVADVFSHSLGDCDYPLACGRNAVCSNNQHCSCPVSSSPRIDYFRAVNDSSPNLGCSQLIPLTCNATQDQLLIELENVKYFTFIADMERVDMETCKQACLRNCSCKAALFQHGSNSSNGDCYLPSDLFTMMNAAADTNTSHTSAFVKVQNIKSPTSSTAQIPRRNTKILVASIAGSFLLLLAVVFLILYIRCKLRWDAKMREGNINEVSGMSRFSYAQLKTATKNFSKKIGQGGFGSVFEGTLEDGTKIAVKCLEGHGQVDKSFLAEVESIGSIHHVNLVRLRGFCAVKSERFLVYDFMSNGSLDRWIYHGDREHALEWKCRKKIIHGIAKGLVYLHEDCRQKIIHLDIKPQNILLDDDFNAKVSDFGLSKLIDRNETRVTATMRGTPGYMAPEWLGSVITEKVDVYSFGIILLEILCGRKNFDISQPEESRHLLGVFQRCWELEVWLDIADKYSEDMQTHNVEVMEMMELASWCLQTDYTKRPSMSTVIKVLDGMLKVESNLNYNFTNPTLQKAAAAAEHEKKATQLLPSVLSGPR